MFKDFMYKKKVSYKYTYCFEIFESNIKCNLIDQRRRNEEKVRQGQKVEQIRKFQTQLLML